MNTLTLFEEYQEKLVEVLSIIYKYVASVCNDDAFRKDGLRANDELEVMAKRLHKRLQEQEEDLAWWKERSLMWTKKAVDLETVRKEIAERCH